MQWAVSEGLSVVSCLARGLARGLALKSRLYLAALLQVLWPLCAVPTYAEAGLTEQLQSLAPEQLEELLVFVAGNTFFTLHHEAGHMLVSELGLPVPGQEEDAVNDLATITMLSVSDDDMDLLLSNAMIGWFINAEDKDGDLVFYDEHDLNLQRGYRVLCLMAGSDPAAFSDLSVSLNLPKDRVEACTADYEQTLKSWETVTEPYLRAVTDTQRQISISYEPAAADLAPLDLFLKESGLMETVANELDSLYKLPDPVRFRAASCGTENAFWNPRTREAVLCYELMAGFAEIYLNSLTLDDL